eukprot:TCONS_00069233-protein
MILELRCFDKISFKNRICCRSHDILSFQSVFESGLQVIMLKISKQEISYSGNTFPRSFYTVSHPNFCKLLHFLYTIPPPTCPLERSYSKLAKLYYKDRNKLTTKHMEVQYKIALLKDHSFNYEAARKHMESSVIALM